MEFISETYGVLTKEQVFDKMLAALKDKYSDYHVWIGTDSQNHKKTTKMVLVICLYETGRGGKIFYHIDHLPKIRVLDDKIYTETENSLVIARELNEFLHAHGVREKVEIHCDIGPKGPTKDLIKPIVGWVAAEGFVPKYKYESVVASTIADRISK